MPSKVSGPINPEPISEKPDNPDVKVDDLKKSQQEGTRVEPESQDLQKEGKVQSEEDSGNPPPVPPNTPNEGVVKVFFKELFKKLKPTPNITKKKSKTDEQDIDKKKDNDKNNKQNNVEGLSIATDSLANAAMSVNKMIGWITKMFINYLRDNKDNEVKKANQKSDPQVKQQKGQQEQKQVEVMEIENTSRPSPEVVVNPELQAAWQKATNEAIDLARDPGELEQQLKSIETQSTDQVTANQKQNLLLSKEAEELGKIEPLATVGKAETLKEEQPQQPPTNQSPSSTTKPTPH